MRTPQPVGRAALYLLLQRRCLASTTLTFSCDRAHIKLTPETLAKVAVLSQKDMKYEAYLGLLQIELVKLQHTIAVEGRKVAVIFEGRDAAGKGGVSASPSHAASVFPRRGDRTCFSIAG